MGELSIKTGTSAISDLSTDSRRTPERLSSQREDFFTATVVDVLVLEKQRTEFLKEVSAPETFPLGTIKIQKTNLQSSESGGYAFAKPMSLHNSMFPRVGEMVKVSRDNSYQAVSWNGSFIIVYYYFEVISSWQNVEHNIVPKNTLFGNVSIADNPETYRTSEIGIPKENQNKTGLSIVETGDVNSLIPLSDNIIQGRGGNSIRLGSSFYEDESIPWKGKYGNPILIIRNGQKASEKGKQIFEDINKDGSSLYFLGGQVIDFIAASVNFESYQTQIQNPQNIVEVKQPPVTNQENLEQQQIQDPVPTNYSVSSSLAPTTSSVDEEFEQIPEVEDENLGQDIESIPITNGVISYVDNIDPLTSKFDGGNTGTSKTNDGSIVRYAKVYSVDLSKVGLVSNDANIPRSGKAFLDLIAYAEGTLGYGDFNGYDMYYNYNKIKDFVSYNQAPPHPNISLKISRRIAGNTTAGGRYQFLYGSWIEINGNRNLPMTKKNQDFAGYKRMLLNVNESDIIAAENNFESFKKVVGGSNQKRDSKSLSAIWASLPLNYTEGGNYGLKGYYNQNTGNQKSMESLWLLYKQFLAKYGQPTKTAILAIGTNDVGTDIDTYNNVKKIIEILKNKNYSNIVVVPPTSKKEFLKVHSDVVKAANYYNVTIEYALYIDKPESPRQTGYHLTNGSDIKNKFPNSDVFGDSNSIRISNNSIGKVGINTRDYLEYLKKIK